MMESCIKQNNGIDIYIEYFEEQDEGTECEAPTTKTVGKLLREVYFSCEDTAQQVLMSICMSVCLSEVKLKFSLLSFLLMSPYDP